MVDQEKIHNQCLSDIPNVRIFTLDVLRIFFSSMPDKQQAWNDLHRLTNDEDHYVRQLAAFVLGTVFPQVPDKQQAWNDLVRLTKDEDRQVRTSAAYDLRFAFSHVPYKQQAWNDLHRLTNDEDHYVRSRTASALGSSFSQVPDKQQAWNDLHRLTNDKDSDVRSSAASALGSVFSQVPDKQQAWNDLHRLTNDEDSDVRSSAAESLGSVFSQVPDKQQAWNDLHRLTKDEDNGVRASVVRSSAASALGSVFSQVPDKQQAWNDLHRLTKDEEEYVRIYANYSLGKVSIFKATKAEKDEDYKKELEKAIKFFETSAKEISYYNPAQFCLPFYRSFHTIVFRKQEAREEVNKYLEEAKSAIKGSESKKQLFETVQNLAEALREVQNMGNLDLPGMKDELNFYRKYCDHAAELMKFTDEKAPFATEVLRKGLPLLDRNLKGLIEEIQERARTTYKESIGSEVEETARAVCKEVQKWEIGSQEEMSWYVNNLVAVLKSKIPHNTENKEILDMIEYMKLEKDITKQYRTLSTVIGLIPTVNVVPEQGLDQIHRKIEYIAGYSDLIYANTIKIDAKLDNISFSIFRIKLNSHNVIANLGAMKKELEKLNEIESLNESILNKLNSTQAKQLNNFYSDIQDRLDDIGSLIDDLPKNNDLKEILDRLNELKQSGLDILLQRSSGITSLISFFAMFAQMYKN